MADTNLDNALTRLRIDRTKKRAPRRRWGRWLVTLALLGGVGAYGVYAKQHAPVPVKVAKAEIERLGPSGAREVLTASGYIIPRKSIEVTSKIVGWVREIKVNRGDQVKAGDVLMRLDDQEYVAQVNQAEAKLGQARVRLTELRAGSRPEEIAAADANANAAAARLRDAEQQYNRLRRLRAEDVVSQQETDTAEQTFNAARATLEATRKNADLIHLGPRAEEISLAEAQVREAEANLAYAKTQLDYTVIKAPIAGTILEKVAEVGELVTNVNFGGTRGAKTSVVTMANLKDLQVEADLNENEIPKVQPGQPAEIRIDSAPDKVYQGAVDELAPQADRMKATVQVKVRVLDPDEKVRPETSARVTFLEKPATKNGADPAAAPRSRVLVPKEALTQGAPGARGTQAKIVYIIQDGRAVARTVQAGEETANGVPVTGLSGGETVIVNPSAKLSDGKKVEVIS